MYRSRLAQLTRQDSSGQTLSQSLLLCMVLVVSDSAFPSSIQKALSFRDMPSIGTWEAINEYQKTAWMPGIGKDALRTTPVGSTLG